MLSLGMPNASSHKSCAPCWSGSDKRIRRGLRVSLIHLNESCISSFLQIPRSLKLSTGIFLILSKSSYAQKTLKDIILPVFLSALEPPILFHASSTALRPSGVNISAATKFILFINPPNKPGSTS